MASCPKFFAKKKNANLYSIYVLIVILKYSFAGVFFGFILIGSSYRRAFRAVGGGEVQRVVDARGEVLLADFRVKARLFHYAERLFAYVREYEPYPFFAAVAEQRFQVFHRRRVDGKYVAHSQDHHLRFFRNVEIAELIHGGKEHRSVYLVYDRSFGYLFRFARGVVRFVLPNAYFGEIGGVFQKEYRRKHDPDRDRNDEVENDGENERRDEHENIAPRRGTADAHEMPPFAHIIRDHKKYRRDDGHRDHFRERHKHEQAQEQDDRVYHTRDRGTSAVFDVRRRSRDRARGGDAAEKPRTDIAYALGDEFGVGIVPISDHTVGHHAGKQGLDRREDRDGKRAGQYRLDRRKTEFGQRRQGKSRRKVGIERSDGIDFERGELNEQDPDDDRDDGRGYLGADLGKRAELGLAQHGPKDQDRHTDTPDE